MLELYIRPIDEILDEETNTFSSFKGQVLQLEHSLISISKWEAIWHRPFLSKEPMTNAQTKSYIECMALTQKYDKKALSFLTDDNIKEVMAYIEDPRTATQITDRRKPKKNNQTITSELIYYWMIAYNIPSDYEKWHINRLMTLIRICNIENSEPEKLKGKELLRENHAINEARRAQARARAKH